MRANYPSRLEVIQVSVKLLRSHIEWLGLKPNEYADAIGMKRKTLARLLDNINPNPSRPRHSHRPHPATLERLLKYIVPDDPNAGKLRNALLDVARYEQRVVARFLSGRITRKPEDDEKAY